MRFVIAVGRGRRWAIDYVSRAARQPMVRSAGMYAGVTAGVKAVAFIKEAVVAAVFGVSGAMDAYLMGLMLIGVPLGLLLNAIQTAFIPQYVEIRESCGKKAGYQFLRSVTSLTLLAMTAALALWSLALSSIIAVIGHGYDIAKQAAVRDVFFLFIPYYFLNGINLVGHGALQADKRFLPSASLPIFTPIATIAIVLWMGSGNVHELVFGFIVGSGLEWLVIHWRLRADGASLTPGMISSIAEMRRLLKEAAVLLGGSFVIAFAPMIEQGLASGLGEGAVAAMGYAFKLPAMISTILVTAVGVTVLPFFSEMLSRGDGVGCKRAFHHYAVALFIGGSVLATILALMSEPLVALIFQRGAFGPEDTAFVAEIQVAYLVQIPGALVGMLAVRLLVARRAYAVVATISALSVVVSAALAWTFSKSIGAVGIALGLSIGASIAAIALVLMALRRLDEGELALENMQ